MVRIIDTTLREGLQSPGVRFDDHAHEAIARALVSLGVDAVECGHPGVGGDDMRRVRIVVAACGDVPVLAHARARRDDIAAVKTTGARWVGIFAGVNPLSRRHRVTSRPDVTPMIRDAVSFAKSLKLSVRFTIEDASRTSWEDLVAGFSAAIEAGADRLCFADTVGVLCPWEIEAKVDQLSRLFGDLNLEVHCHDDRGMADANALSAVRGGAGWVSAAVNGIGERCGITDTLLLLPNLDALGVRPLHHGDCLAPVGRLVQMHSRFIPDRRRPIVGENAFSHVAKLHRRAVLQDEMVYSWVEPARIGRTTTTTPPMRPERHEGLIARPERVSRSHRNGSGHISSDHRVMMADTLVPDARQTCEVWQVGGAHGQEAHEGGRRLVDRLFVIMGANPDMTGLALELDLGGEMFLVESPASIFIPSGMSHGYRIVSGEGRILAHERADPSRSDAPTRQPLERFEDRTRSDLPNASI